MRILITGGAGYVGSVLTPFLLNQGHEITIYDLMLYKTSINNHNNLKIIKGDIRDKDKFYNSLKNIDLVIHLACISNDPSFELNPALGKSINLDCFPHLVESSINQGVKRFIFASSSSVYGVKKEIDVHEEMSLEPLTDYSKFKAQCEETLLKYKSNNFETVIVRPATVCGYSPRQRLDVVVNIFSNFGFNKRAIEIYGGEQLRPNIHINDMCEVYSLLINSQTDKINGKIFNAGYENKKVKELAQIVKNVMGNDIEIIKKDSNDQRSYHISSKKIYKELGFINKFSITDAVNGLKNAFEKNMLPNSFEDENYFNIKKMQKINLQ